jgi:hypothetical protein
MLAHVPEQSVSPNAHDGLQEPAEHTSSSLQARSHVPQCALLDCRFTHSPEQLKKPGLQLMPQRPPLHTALPFAGTLHVMPHSPQCCVFKDVLTHWALQAVSPRAQLMPQLPAAQTAVPFTGTLQVVPQPEQLAGSLAVSTQRVPHRV